MPESTTTPFLTRHSLLLGKEPTDTQLKLYAKFPEFRGFSDRALDSEKLEALVVIGLTFGIVNQRVFLFAPVAHETWVIDEINRITDQVFEACRKQRNPVVFARACGELFKKIVILGRLLQLHEEPERWISFGFVADDVLPAWMPKRLLVE